MKIMKNHQCQSQSRVSQGEKEEEEDIEDGAKPQAKLSFACSLHKS